MLIPLPGHTPGTTGALVALDRSGKFLLASDAVSVRETLDRDVIPRNTWNADALVKSLAEIKRIEKQRRDGAMRSRRRAMATLAKRRGRL